MEDIFEKNTFFSPRNFTEQEQMTTRWFKEENSEETTRDSNTLKIRFR